MVRRLVALAVTLLVAASALLPGDASAQVPTPQQVGLTPMSGAMRVTWLADAWVTSGQSKVRVIPSPNGQGCESTFDSCVVTGLKNGTAYTFEVAFVTGRGETGPSTVAGPAWPCCDLPSAPVSVAVEPSLDSVVVSWEPPANVGAAGREFTYRVATEPVGGACATSERSCRLTGLENGTPYIVSVTASNSTGTGSAARSASVTPVGPPGSPTDVRAFLGERGRATITWLAPQQTGGAPVTRYAVTSTPPGIACESTSQLSCDVTGLTNGESYSFSVTAFNAAGAGLISLPSRSARPLARPGTPTRLAVTLTGARAKVRWSAPVGGARPTRYDVRSSPAGARCTTAGTSCVVSGLRPGTTYAFTVEAVAGRTTGIPAQTRTVRTSPVPVSRPEPPQKPAAPVS